MRLCAKYGHRKLISLVSPFFIIVYLGFYRISAIVFLVRPSLSRERFISILTGNHD